MTDEQQDAFVERVAEQVLKRHEPQGWQKFGTVITPVLGIAWSVASVVAVPWFTWVTVSIIKLAPAEERYTASESVMEHTLTKAELRRDIAVAVGGIETKLDEQTKLLNDLNLKLARKGIE
jgi:hypothetical protein